MLYNKCYATHVTNKLKRAGSVPPKIKFDKEAIVAAAFNVVRKKGWQGLSARSIAQELNSSTKPIYSRLNSMKNLEEEVIKKALTLIEEYASTPRTGDKFLDHGYGYVLFAKHEKHLFKALFDERYNQMYSELSVEVFQKLGRELSDHPHLKDIPKERLDNLRKARWLFTHGLASVINAGYGEIREDEQIIWLINVIDDLLILGLKAKIEREKQDKTD